ncbi:aspartyl protease [Argonema antarcticum]|uniref:aspartyl protease n=1 Tax=Argonema antarcticum TaxID=2942763 RepID=UPI002012B3E4|nr:aspartyl protease [Argonema antarcticum]MCL1470969.1 aspartyl protease [Argonema antarcticum A004/B2]
MIEGKFGDDEELFFEIELIAADGLELPVDAMLDTGFSDWLAIDKQDLEGLDWPYVGERNMRIAKGEANFDIYVGKVRIDGEEFDIPVHVGDGVPEILIGRQWLKSRRLVVDMQSNVLTLGGS